MSNTTPRSRAAPVSGSSAPLAESRMPSPRPVKQWVTMSPGRSRRSTSRVSPCKLMCTIMREPLSPAARSASSTASTLWLRAMIPARNFTPSATSRCSRIVAAVSRGRACRRSSSSPRVGVGMPRQPMWTNGRMRTGAPSMAVRRNSAKLTQPQVPASTAVVTPPRSAARGSMPYRLPS